MCDRTALIAAILVACMFVVNAGLIISNRHLQETLVEKQNEVANKNTRINQNATFANINQSLVQALATAAVARKDEQIKALLIQNNINLNPKASTTSPAAP